jgi:hypothetical protein
MKARFAIAASLLALAGCQPPAEIAKPVEGTSPTPVDTAATDGCNVSVEKAWIDQETPVRRYTAHASVLGPTCDQGVAVLVIRQREGTPIYTWSGLTTYLFGLKDAHDPAAMKAALTDWIDQGNVMNNTTDRLPPWEETDGQPKAARIPVHARTCWFEKAQYDDLRCKARSSICCVFPQGIESSLCLTLLAAEDGAPISQLQSRKSASGAFRAKALEVSARRPIRYAAPRPARTSLM